MLLDLESNKVQEGFKPLLLTGLAEILPNGARLETSEGILEATAFAPGIFRLQLEKRKLPSYNLLTEGPQPVEMNLKKTENRICLEIPDGILEIEKHPDPVRMKIFRLESDGNRKNLLESSTDRTIQGQLRLMPFGFNSESGQWLISLGLKSKEGIFGLGEKFGPLNKRGQLITNWNRDATGVNSELSYKNSPFAWSTEGWGIFLNTPSRVTHGVGYSPWSHRSYVLKFEDENLDFFLFVAKNPAEILQKFTWLVGRAPALPLWSFGVWMSKAFYENAEEFLNVAQKLRLRKIPCDVITLDGRAWHKPETRFDFSWDPDRYPDPEKLMAILRKLNLRLCLWEYPYLSIRNPLFAELDQKGFFLKNSDGNSSYVHRWFPPPNDSMVPQLQPSGIIDFTNPDAYNWFRDMHRNLIKIGVAVMKTDYGEAVPEDVLAFNGDTGKRIHNVYSLLYNRCTFEAFQLYGADQGALVWGRAGWTGSAACPVQWGGDPQSDWEGLAASIRGGLSWGLSGVPFYTSDIGGFYGETVGQVMGSGKSEPELFVRWTQVGVMSSHTRFHGVGPREPWEYGEEIEAIVRRWLAWRYRLIPYLQDCAQEARMSGLPVARAMPLIFPEDPAAWTFDTQYMLGPALLVAPILEPGGQMRFYLPPGAWYDLWTGERLEGPKTLQFFVPLDRLPVFGREGCSLRLGPAVQHTGELGPESPVEEIHFSGDRICPIMI